MRDPRPIGGAYRQLVQECPRLRHRCIWVVRGKHNPVDTDLKHQVEERRREVESAERVVHILA